MTAGIRLSDDELLETIAAVEKEGSYRGAGRALNLDKKAISDRMKRAAERGMIKPASRAMPGYAVKSVASKAEDGAWVKQVKEPGEIFVPPDGYGAGRITVLTDAEGRETVKWQRWERNVDWREVIKAAIDEFKAELPRAAAIRGPEHANESLLNQYTITDLHFGMLAWGEETGSDYDLKIAEKLLLDWFSAAIAMSPDAEIGLLAQLGDLMHHDSLQSVTPQHKNVLDADSRLQKIIRVVIRVMRQIIAMMLAKHPRVHIVMASGNHDEASSIWIRELLATIYSDEPRVTVDVSPSLYHVYEFGKTALFYHHGHRRTIKDVDTVFAGEFREIYGRCKQSYAHIGHFHNDEVRESNLMKTERHRTLAAPDAHTSGGGWRSGRDAKVITYHKEHGEVFRSILSPEMVSAA